jgi:hypothetical protein
MRGVALVVVLAPLVTHAGPTDQELTAEGTELAQQGRFAEAIDKFKAADRIHASAADACLIALAYTRRQLWSQAEIWLDTCRARATASDQLPDWTEAATEQIRTQLADANVAAVEIVVQPSAPGARVSVSSFALDESFAPRTIHLPFGRHDIVVSAPGYQDGRTELIVDDKKPRRVVISLNAVIVHAHRGGGLRSAGLAAAGVGVVALGAGVAFGLAARKDANSLSGRTDQWTTTDEATYAAGRTANNRMIASYVVGGALVVAGGVVYYLGARYQVAPVVTGTSAGVALAGQF